MCWTKSKETGFMGYTSPICNFVCLLFSSQNLHILAYVKLCMSFVLHPKYIHSWYELCLLSNDLQSCTYFVFFPEYIQFCMSFVFSPTWILSCHELCLISKDFYIKNNFVCLMFSFPKIYILVMSFAQWVKIFRI